MIHKNKKFIFTAIVIYVFSFVCYSQNHDFLIKVFEAEYDQVGIECAYINLSGDTIVPMGKYHYCYTGTLKNYAIVLTKNGKCIAIDKNDRELFEVFWFDSGPDYVREGLFRIKKDGRIGYANEKGRIVIKPQFECAFPFESERAKVSNNCETIPDGEYRRWVSDEWFYIDKTGKKIKKL